MMRLLLLMALPFYVLSFIFSLYGSHLPFESPMAVGACMTLAMAVSLSIGGLLS